MSGLPEHWFCALNRWDPLRNRCEAPEEFEEPIGEQHVFQSVPEPERRAVCCVTGLAVRAAELALKATSATGGDHGEDFKTDEKGTLYLLECATGCGQDGHLYRYFENRYQLATDLVLKLTADAAARLPWKGRRALLPVPHGGLESQKGDRVHGLAKAIEERAPGAQVVDTVLELDQPLGPKVWNDFAQRRDRHAGRWHADPDELQRLDRVVDVLVVVDDAFWTRATLDAIVGDLEAEIARLRLKLRVETLVFARLVSYTHKILTFAGLKPSIAAEVATVANAQMALDGDQSTADTAHGGLYYRISVPWFPEEFYVGSHIVTKSLWTKYGEDFLTAVHDGVVSEIHRLSKLMLATRANGHHGDASRGGHTQLFRAWFKRCQAYALQNLEGAFKEFRVQDYIEMQGFVSSLCGETRTSFLYRIVRGLEQGGLDDVFARFPEYIHNIERLANGGGGSYYVLDPLQDNRRVPAAWTIGAQRRSNVTRAERGLPLITVRTQEQFEQRPAEELERRAAAARQREATRAAARQRRWEFERQRELDARAAAARADDARAAAAPDRELQLRLEGQRAAPPRRFSVVQWFRESFLSDDAPMPGAPSDDDVDDDVDDAPMRAYLAPMPEPDDDMDDMDDLHARLLRLVFRDKPAFQSLCADVLQEYDDYDEI